VGVGAPMGPIIHTKREERIIVLTGSSAVEADDSVGQPPRVTSHSKFLGSQVHDS
jgi:hypothetical protein